MSKARKRQKKQQNTPNIPKQYIGVAFAVVGIILIGIVGWLATRSSDGIPDDFVPEVVGAPSASVSTELVDYGDVKMGTTLETVFEVTNVGDEILYILGEPRVELIEGC